MHVNVGCNRQGPCKYCKACILNPLNSLGTMEVNQVRRDLWPSLQDTPQNHMFPLQKQKKNKNKVQYTNRYYYIWETQIYREQESQRYGNYPLFTRRKKEEIEFFKSRSQQLAANYKNNNYEKKHPPSTTTKIKLKTIWSAYSLPAPSPKENWSFFCIYLDSV